MSGIHLSGKRMPLLFVRTWPGELDHYRRLAAELGPDQPVYTVPPPFFDRAAEMPMTVEAWASAAFDAVREHLDRQELVVGGWSFGGVVGLDVAQRLDSVGFDVARVLMIDTRLPTPHPKGRRANVPERVVRHLSRLRELGWKEGLTYLQERREARRAALAKRKTRVKPLRASELPERVPHDEEERRAHLMHSLWVSYLKYQAPPVALPTTLLWCEETREHTNDCSLGWAPHIRRGLESVPIPGKHMTLFDDANIAGLAAAVARTLREFDARA